MSDTHYQSLGMSNALEKQGARSKRSRLIVIGAVVGLVVLIAVGVVVGVVVTKNNSSNNAGGTKSSSSAGGNSTSGGSSTSGGTSTTKGNDPSNFTKDPNLHKSFYGMAYTPEGALVEFGCTNTLAGVIKDIQLLSQLTTRIRLYGADCNQTAQVLEAIKQTKVDMEVFVGNYVIPSDTPGYQRQRDAIHDAIATYGADHIAGITVGNEFMLNYLTDHGSQDPNSSVGNEGAAILIADINDTKSGLSSMKLSKTVAIGNSDAGSYFNNQVLSAVEYGMSNVHAWFANTTAEAAAAWVMTFFDETNVQPASLLPNKPKMYIAETGWPTKSSDAGNASNGAATASIKNLQTFLDTFVCQANKANIGYFFFEGFDEEWKDIKFGGVEGWWGLFNKDRTLKDLKIPNCPL